MYGWGEVTCVHAVVRAQNRTDGRQEIKDRKRQTQESGGDQTRPGNYQYVQ